jgi:hypothetical protein
VRDYHPKNKALLLFGGGCCTSNLADTWVYKETSEQATLVSEKALTFFRQRLHFDFVRLRVPFHAAPVFER